MYGEKLKAVTFSFDDGVTQDKRLVELFNKYNLKATFNINSELLGKKGELVRNSVKVRHDKLLPEEVKAVYCGHEIASHTLTHPFLPDLSKEEVITQVENDRLRLSELAGYEVVGFAYPGGGKNFDERTADIIKAHTGVKYARTTAENYTFDLQNNLFMFAPTLHAADFEAATKYVYKFIDNRTDIPQLLYIWGHSYEFDTYENGFERFEELLQLISGHDDIFYGTNREIFGL